MLTVALVLYAIVLFHPLVDEHMHGPVWWSRTALAQAATALFTFDGAPSIPQSFVPTTWDVQVHHNGREWWRQFPATPAQHGPDCSPPPATHTAATHEQAVFVCNNHVMTVIEAGYGVVYLTPDQLVDFSTDEAVVRFDMSTLRTSTRDWVDLWVTPYEENLALPLDEGTDLNGPPRRAVHLKMGWGGSTFFAGTVFREFAPTGLTLHNVGGIENVLTPSATQREPFELRLSRTRVRFGLPNRNMWWVDQAVSDLGWTRGVIQFGHHTYIAEKGCIQFNPTTGGYDGAPELASCPNTWHWDNVSIDPAVPFTILRADRRYVDSTTPQGVTFPAPAPSGAHLRFGGIGSGIQVSFDGGSTWQPAQPRAQRGSYRFDAFGSYWTPIPAGTNQVLFRSQDGTGGWMARDISVFASEEPPAEEGVAQR